jgi:tetratricopeptide (TPR) repeat protein
MKADAWRKKKERRMAVEAPASTAEFFSGQGWTKVLYGLLYISLALVPLFFRTGSVDGYITVKKICLGVLAGGLLVAWLFQATAANGDVLRVPGRFLFGVAIFWLWLTSSLIGVENLYEGLAVWAHWSAVLTAGVLACGLLRSEQALLATAGVIAGTGLCVAVYGWLQWLGWEPFLSGKTASPVSFLGNRIYAAEYQLMAWPAAVAVAVLVRRKWLRRLCFAAAFLILGHIVISLARGAWFGLAVGLLIAAGICLRNPKVSAILRKHRGGTIAAGLTVIALLAAFGHTPKGQELGGRLASIFDPYTVTNRQRMGRWETALKMIGERPLRGVGAGQFQLTYPQHRSPEQRRLENYNTYVAHMHNDFLHLTVETGLVGLAALALILWPLLRGGFYAASRWNEPRQTVTAAFLVGMLSLLCAACFAFPLYLPATGLTFWVMAGALAGVTGGKTVELSHGFLRRLRIPLRLAAGAFLFAAAGVGAVIWLSGTALDEAMGARKKNLGGLEEEACARAARLRPWDFHARFEYGRTLQRREKWDAALAEFDEVLRLHPWHDWVWREIGDVRKAKGDLAGALEAYDRALINNPAHVGVLVHRGLLLSQQKNYDEAIKTFLTALAVGGEDVAARCNLGNVYMEMGDFQAAADVYRAALRRAPKHVMALASLGLAIERQGGWGMAARQYELSLESQPQWVVYNALARVRLKLGDKAEAVESWRQSLKLNPRQPDIQNLLKQYASGEKENDERAPDKK